MTDNGSKPADNFPVDSFEEAAPHLRRPFAKNAVKFKVQANLSNNRGLIVGYIDARLVAERLNLVCPAIWEDRYEPYGDRIDSGLLLCHLTVGNLTRTDIGEGKGKAAYSDAFKRAAVKFGVGVSLYALPQQILDSTPEGKLRGDGKPTLRAVTKGNKKTLYLTGSCEKFLAERYEEWLQGPGRVFSDPLDHGDVEGSVGSLLEGGAAADEPEQGNLELAAKRAEIETIYQGLAPAQRPKLTPGRFDAKLRGAESEEQLDRLLAEVKELQGAAA